MSETTEPHDLVSRVLAGTDSLSAITEETIAERAAELAKIEGRTEPNEADVAAARADLLTMGRLEIAPEVAASGVEDVTTWDESPDATGVRTERVPLEDETSAAQTLIEEGIEEADHDLRVSSADENPVEEE